MGVPYLFYLYHPRCGLLVEAKSVFLFSLQGVITPHVPLIFDAVFECTLEMINKDFQEFPEYRTNFFLMIQAVTSHCFAGQSLLC